MINISTHVCHDKYNVGWCITHIPRSIEEPMLKFEHVSYLKAIARVLGCFEDAGNLKKLETVNSKKYNKK